MKINLNISIWVALSILTVSATGCKKETTALPTTAPVAQQAAPTSSPTAMVAGSENKATEQKIPDLTTDPASGLSRATVTITTDKGKIKYKFFAKEAPKTSTRIVELIQKGFYNGLTFHRVEDWVIQGGDPTGTGTGGSGQRLKAEFNLRKHREGTLGMARSADPDSADSQFYIVFGTQPHLDNNYTVFGQVTEGMDVARKIQRGDKMSTVTIE